MPPKSASKRPRTERPALTCRAVRSIFGPDTLMIIDAISDGAEPSQKVEEDIFNISMDLQNGFEALAKQKEAFEKECTWRKEMLDRTESMVNRLLTAVEDRPAPQQRRPNRRDYESQNYDYNSRRRDDRRGGYEGDYGRQNDYRRTNTQRRSPPPPPPEWVPEQRPYDNGLRPSSPTYTTSSPRGGGGGNIANLLSNLSASVPEPQRPYSPTTGV